ncbi:MAG: efflux RND transporter periplasmic adaptor subunit [Gemmataceae bacterium]
MAFLRARICCLLLGLLGVVAGCGKRGHEAPQGGANVPLSKVRLKRNVDVATVKQERMASFVETVGYLEAEGQTDIAAGVSGMVVDVLFREGDFVEKDKTLLARIDPSKYKALLSQAEANLNKAQANVERMEALTKKCDAAIRDATQTLDLRRVVLDNIRRAGRAAKIEERQEAQANVEMTTARLEVAKADRSVCDADINAARKEVEAAQAMLAIARRNFELSEVRAPYTGQINQRKVTRGMYLEDKTVIATMADLSRLRLVGYIPERATPVVRQMLAEERQLRAGFLAGSLFAGLWGALAALHNELEGATPPSLEFEVRPFPHRKFTARIFYLSTVANPDTHLFECKAEVPTHGLGAELRPGFTAKVRCPLPGRPTSIIVPEVAVRASERGFVAFRPRVVTTKDGQAEYVAEAVPLELGQREPGWVEVLKGLQAGDIVVTKGAEALEDGTPLAIPKERISLLQNGR